MSKRKNPEPGWIYLMWCVGTTRWKIGYSKDVTKRWEALECASLFPIRIVAAMRGIVSDEQRLHIDFRHYRSHREWFDFPEEAIVWKLLERFGITFAQAFAIAQSD